MPSLAIIAGSGILPMEVAKRANSNGVRVVGILHRNEADPLLESICDSYTWIRVGQLGAILRVLKRERPEQALFAGGISRVRLFGGGLRPDFKAIRLVTRLKSIKDDVLLRGVSEEIEKLGIKVISVSEILSECRPQAGTLTRRSLSQSEMQDAYHGWQAAKALGQADVGQTVVVSKGLVVAVEAVEGTDATIERGGALAGSGAVVVKLSKPQQDLRLDLPTIGIKTIESMARAGAKALVLEEGKAILLEPEKIKLMADSNDITIQVYRDVQELESSLELYGKRLSHRYK